MRVDLRERYVELVNYLGLVLGPSYEIALYDLSIDEGSIIAIANGHITNRTIGAPLTLTILDIISQEKYKHSNYEVNYYSKSKENKVLRSSIIYIKDKNKLVGLMSISFDDSKYKDLSNMIMGLCHPDDLISGFTFEKLENLDNVKEPEIISGEVDELVNNSIDNIIKNNQLDNKKLKKRDRVFIVKELVDSGIFLLKGAVTEVAKKLNSSEATIYRYINEIEVSRNGIEN